MRMGARIKEKTGSGNPPGVRDKRAGTLPHHSPPPGMDEAIGGPCAREARAFQCDLGATVHSAVGGEERGEHEGAIVEQAGCHGGHGVFGTPIQRHTDRQGATGA